MRALISASRSDAFCAGADGITSSKNATAESVFIEVRFYQLKREKRTVYPRLKDCRCRAAGNQGRNLPARRRRAERLRIRKQFFDSQCLKQNPANAIPRASARAGGSGACSVESR